MRQYGERVRLFYRANYALPYVVLFLLLSGCIPTKNVPEGQYLLVRQSFQGNREVPTESLESFFKQKPNRKIFYLPIMPYLYAYRAGEKKFQRKRPRYERALQQAQQTYGQRQDALQQAFEQLLAEGTVRDIRADSLKMLQKIQRLQRKKNDALGRLQTRLNEGNWLMRSVGEPPTLYDSALCAQTSAQVTRYLQQNGFFRVSVETVRTYRRKKVSLRYQVQEGEASQLRQVTYQIADSAIRQLVLADTLKAHIQQGKQYREAHLEAERGRLTRLLSNVGYFNFNTSFIFFEVDTFQSPLDVRLTVAIRNPPSGRAHRIFQLDEVVFKTDVGGMQERRVLEDTLFRGIRYVEEKNRFSKRVLDSKIFIRPDSLYSLSRTERTQRALAQLDMFKFVNVNYDTLGGTFKANIFTNPYDKYQYALEAGLNVAQALPGPFVSLSLKNRNTFGGCEILEIRGRVGIEAQASVTEDSDSYNSQEYGANISLSFPRILLPMSLKLNRWLNMYAPRTQISSGFSFIDRPEYSRTNLQSVLTYQWRNANNARFDINLLDAGVIYTTRLSEAFETRLQELEAQGNTLALSFDRSLISSFVAAYVQSSDRYALALNKTHYFKIHLESGGNYLNFVGDRFFEGNEAFLGLRLYRFAKFFVDYRQAWPIGEHTELVSRGNVGIAKPYGQGTRVLPYEKYFFSGGSNSNRAWRPRRLGPGGYTPPLRPDGTFDYSFEQIGEVILELNAELRGHLFSFFDYALFVDAGNIWMTEEDVTRPGAKFTTRNFWREIAVGAGAGLRLDFSFLLVRFDLGIKMYDPALPLGQRFVGNQLSLRRPLGAAGQSVLNIGVGYPF